MEISKNSWHFKMYKKCVKFWQGSLFWEHEFNDNLPRTLCAYFWSVVIFPFLALFKCLMVTAIVSVIPIVLWSAFMNHSQSAQKISLIFGIIFCLGFIINRIVIYLDNKNIRKYKALVSGETSPLTFIDVVVNFIKAKKQRVCPFIEYTKKS